MKSFETPAGKTIQLFREPRTHHIKIKFGEGGELPEILTGMYNSEMAAERDILIYLESIKDRKPKAK